MLQAALTTLQANPNFVSLGALILSVFFAGTMLQGERTRKQDVKDALAEIEALSAASLERVEEINADLETQDAELVGQIDEAYDELARISEREEQALANLEQTNRRNRQLQQQNQQNREAVRSSTDFIFGDN